MGLACMRGRADARTTTTTTETTTSTFEYITLLGPFCLLQRAALAAL